MTGHVFPLSMRNRGRNLQITLFGILRIDFEQITPLHTTMTFGRPIGRAGGSCTSNNCIHEVQIFGPKIGMLEVQRDTTQIQNIGILKGKNNVGDHHKYKTPPS